MKLQTKLSLSLLATAVIITIYMTFFIQWNFGRGFLDYVKTVEDREIAGLSERLSEFWAHNKDWSFLRGDTPTIYKLYAETLPDEELQKKILGRIANRPNHWRSPKGPLPKIINLPLTRRIYVFDRDQRQIYGHDAIFREKSLRPILYKDSVIGYLGHHPVTVLKEKDQQMLVKEQRQATLLIGVAALLVTFGVSIPFARHLARPVEQLSLATKRLIGGDFSVRLRPKTQDEIGRLTTDFNSLATTLEQNELTQKRWLSDISHELRTPLSILQGEIEAMQDGIRKADKDGLAGLHREVAHLNLLVEDLYQLARAEDGLIYQKDTWDLVAFINEQHKKYVPKFAELGLDLVWECNVDDVSVFADRARLHQVFDNTFHNSLRYTDSGGRVVLALCVTEDIVTLTFDDSAPGVGHEECERLFDRLYRVERSRNRNLGGAGIGLAVCQNIISAHDGTIVAAPSTLGGLSLQITLPVYKQV